MIQDILSIGDKIDLKLLSKTGKPALNNRTYVSQLIDFVDNEVIRIATPIVYGKLMILPVGNYFNLCFYSNKNLFECNCVVMNSYKENNLNITQVRINSDLEKVQRRQYYRLECLHDIKYRVITVEEENLSNKSNHNAFTPEQIWNLATMTNISGGGARFNSDLNHQTGDKIWVDMEFFLASEHVKLLIAADIISSIRLENRSGVYEHRIKFTDISKKDRENIIKYIFEQDRRRRKNDRGI